MRSAQKTVKPAANAVPKPVPQVPAPQIAAPPPKLIFVRDLHPSVAAKDLIMDVFREDGDITSVSVHADVHGQSLGTAEIQFRSGEEAESAFRRHNGRVYKGKVMRMSLVGLEIKNVRPKAPNAAIPQPPPVVVSPTPVETKSRTPSRTVLTQKVRADGTKVVASSTKPITAAVAPKVQARVQQAERKQEQYEEDTNGVEDEDDAAEPAEAEAEAEAEPEQEVEAEADVETEPTDQEEVIGFPDGEEEKDTKIVFSMGQPKPPPPRSVSQKFLANISSSEKRPGAGVKRKDPEVHVTLKGAPKTKVAPSVQKSKVVVKKRR